MRFRTEVCGRTFEIEVDHDQLVWVDGRPLYLDLERLGGLPVYALTLDGAGYVLFVDQDQEQYQVEIQGQIYPVRVEPDQPNLAARPAARPDVPPGPTLLTAPLPGRLLRAPVSPGESVAPGQVLVVVESMKMQMELKAPHAGVVEAVHAAPNTDVAQGQLLVTLTPP